MLLFLVLGFLFCTLAEAEEKRAGDPWYKKAYRRNVVDMHITELKEEFFSEFDAETYVKLLKSAQVQSAVVYAHSHVGLSYYPTQVGHMNKQLKGRDVFGELLDSCHRQNVAVAAYFSVIHDSWAYLQNQDWRIIRPNGQESSAHSRYGLCCPNSPYRDYVVRHVAELCAGYDFDGIRFDMTFWPGLCYCKHCAMRFEKEVGGALPRTIDWEDPNWVAFQRCREAWLAEFAGLITQTVKGIKPHVSVEHQSSIYNHSWSVGVTEALSFHSDFLQGDFYGDALQGSYIRKLFHNMSETLPYGFETSFSVNLRNHTAKKSLDLLRCKAYACLADGGAFVFIDAIDPVGTLDPSVYEIMQKVFSETNVYEPYTGGNLCQDVGIYLNLQSKFDFSDNGKDVTDGNVSRKMPHVDAGVSVCKSLLDHHIPFGVITRKNLEHLSRHKIIVLPNVYQMAQDEVVAIRDYVGQGGTIYASKFTSLYTPDGRRQADFMLKDVFGVSFQGKTEETFTYIAPVNGNESIFDGTQKHPLGLHGRQLRVKASPQAKVLATLTLPYTHPHDFKKYAAIHSNPPGIATEYPTVIMNKFGKGKAIYVSADLENNDVHRNAFINLIRLLHNEFTFSAQAPKAVEVTMYHQPEKNRYIISLVNFQKELPNIPVSDIRLAIHIPHGREHRLLQLPEESEWELSHQGNTLTFTAPRLENFLMFALIYN